MSGRRFVDCEVSAETNVLVLFSVVVALALGIDDIEPAEPVTEDLAEEDELSWEPEEWAGDVDEAVWAVDTALETDEELDMVSVCRTEEEEGAVVVRVAAASVWRDRWTDERVAEEEREVVISL